MDSGETEAFGSNTSAGEIREYHARHVGRAKYAIVLSGERDEVVGWGYDEESAIKVAQALKGRRKQLRSGSMRPDALMACSVVSASLPIGTA